MASNVEESRKNIAVTIVGLFMAVAFSSMASNVTEEVQHLDLAPRHGYWPSVTLTLAAAFFLVGISFLVGIIRYLFLFQPEKDRTEAAWNWDLISSIVTLTIICFLGSTSVARTAHAFVAGLIALHAFQLVWAWVRARIFKQHETPYKWKEYAQGLTLANVLILALSIWTPRAIYLVLIPSAVLFWHDLFVRPNREPSPVSG